MARDEWRVRIELAEAGGARTLLDRLGLDLGSEARELAKELEARRLAVTHDADSVFVYAASHREADAARAVVEAELRDLRLEPRIVALEHWLDEDDRWDDDPPAPSVDEELRARGYAPWEVRVESPTRQEAIALEQRLESEGYDVSRDWRYVVAGTATHEDAVALARRLHGDVEPGGEMAWEVVPANPFAIFGGLGT